MALEHFMMNSESYVLIISDLRMPRLWGTDLLKKVKKSNPSVRTILMTAFAIDENLFKNMQNVK